MLCETQVHLKLRIGIFSLIISISSYAILDHNVACLKLQILQIVGFVASLLRGKLDIEFLSSVNVNGSCMPNSLRSQEQMRAYDSALLGFLCLYPFKVSLVWIIASPSGSLKPSPSHCIWKLCGISGLTNTLNYPCIWTLPYVIHFCPFGIKFNLPNCSIFMFSLYLFILKG